MSQAASISNIDDLDLYNMPEFFCEALAKIERVGSCRRLIFVIHQTVEGRRNPVGVVKLVLPGEVMPEIAQMAAADSPEDQGAIFRRIPINAVAN